MWSFADAVAVAGDVGWRQKCVLPPPPPLGKLALGRFVTCRHLSTARSTARPTGVLALGSGSTASLALRLWLGGIQGSELWVYSLSSA
eukprot:350551-Chlamydomonas_euryale.AAC.8